MKAQSTVLSVHLWARININIIRPLWKIPERDYKQRFLRRSRKIKRREINGCLLNAQSRWVTLSLNTLSSSFTEQIGLSFHSLFSPLKGHGQSLERGFWKLVKWQKRFSIGIWKRLSEIWSRVITSTPFLPSPCSPSPSPKFSCQREVQESYVRWWGQVWALPSWLNECDVHGLRPTGDAH